MSKLIYKEKIVGDVKVLLISVVARGCGRGNWRRLYVMCLPKNLEFKSSKNKLIDIKFSDNYRVSLSYSEEFSSTDRYKNSSQGICFSKAENIFKNTIDELVKNSI